MAQTKDFEIDYHGKSNGKREKLKMSNVVELDLMDIKQASVWASRHLGKNVTTSNIAENFRKETL